MEDGKNLNQDIHLDAGANRIAARSAGGGDWTRCGPLGLGFLLCAKFLGFIAAMCHDSYKSIAKTTLPQLGWGKKQPPLGCPVKAAGRACPDDGTLPRAGVEDVVEGVSEEVPGED